VVNGFSIDVEEWFHICGVGGPLAPERWPALPSRVVDTTRRLLDLLARCDVRATFFVLGWVAERHPALVGEILGAGHEIGSHGHTHRRVYELSDEAFVDELARSRRALAAAGAPAVVQFRAPEWSINDRSPRALGVLAGEGFTLDSSMAPLRVVGNPSYPTAPHRRQTTRGTILELPPFVGRWFGQQVPLGGGWGMRISRPRAVLRAIEARNREGVPAVLWVHPWELDPDPPRVRLPPGLWAAHYLGLRGFGTRLREVLSGAAFGPLSQVAAGVDRAIGEPAS
jgi:polysaccharide deacetylase family protein (PEP-CTERM system associated)